MKSRNKNLGGLKLGIHATNISGLGAVNLVLSLLPELELVNAENNTTIFVPVCGPLSKYISPLNFNGRIIRYDRNITNGISRILECLFPSKKYRNFDSFIVLGDIPLRQIKNQVVYVHQPHLASPEIDINSSKSFKYVILRLIFKINLKYASHIIVQTHSMKAKLIASYQGIDDRVSVISAPPPAWFGDFNRISKSFAKNRLRLFYPAAAYPHKNHKLLSSIAEDNSVGWPIQDLILTVEDSNNPNANVSWIKCVGLLNASQCLRAYEEVDALLFLSTAESYGLPLVEAMVAGLPIICPDLEYSRVLCGEEAIYFNHDSIQSLKSAIIELNERLSVDWRPDWIQALENIPKNWGEVARQILALTSH